MSSGSLEQREKLLGEFAREVRQFNGLSASFFRAAAARSGMNVTDLQVADILDITGPATAGQLAELMGLTTGAITGMIDRLEKAGLVRRERDPEDGRRVIVRLTPTQDALRQIGPTFDSIGRGWDQIASGYDDGQLALLLEFLKRSNGMVREEIARLRETPEGEGRGLSAPLGDVESGRLVVSAEMSELTLRAGTGMTDLYQANFSGSMPNVQVKEGMITVRYPRRLWLLDRRQRTAEITLSTAIPWQIVIRGGVSEFTAQLDGLDLLGLEANGAASTFRLELPYPSGVVPIRIGGSGSEFMIRRPAGVAARAHLKGWTSQLVLDDQIDSGAGGDVRLQSPDYGRAAQRYDIEASGSGSMFTITSG